MAERENHRQGPETYLTPVLTVERDRPFFPFAHLKIFAAPSRVAPLACTPFTFHGIDGAIAAIAAIEPTPPEFTTPLGPVRVSYLLQDDREVFEELPLRLALRFRPQSVAELTILARHTATIRIGDQAFSLFPAGAREMQMGAALTLAAGGAADVVDHDLREHEDQEHVIYLPYSEVLIRQVEMTLSEQPADDD